MHQPVDLAETKVPFFFTVGGREVAVMDGEAMRELQDKAARWDAMSEAAAKRAQLPGSMSISAGVIHKT